MGVPSPLLWHMTHAVEPCRQLPSSVRYGLPVVSVFPFRQIHSHDRQSSPPAHQPTAAVGVSVPPVPMCVCAYVLICNICIHACSGCMYVIHINITFHSMVICRPWSSVFLSRRLYHITMSLPSAALSSRRVTARSRNSSTRSTTTSGHNTPRYFILPVSSFQGGEKNCREKI